MKFDKVERHFSIPRIHRYLQICGADKNRAVRLYQASLKLAQAFHPLIGVLEVVFRNRVYAALADHFGDSNWIIAQAAPGGFMSSKSLSRTGFYMRQQVTSSSNKLRTRGAAVTGHRVMSEQTFGFWTDLFEPHHFRLVGGSPIRAFAHLPVGKKRIDVANDLTKIRRFRNRINHNEPIILRGDLLDFDTVSEVYDSMIDVFIWIDPELIDWIKPLDQVQRAISKCELI